MTHFFTPRPSQQKIIDALLNAGGPIRLGVSAVPGSGKTHILSYLASALIERVGDDQEVLIVTLVNAAVDNFRRRVDGFVRAKGLLPGFNYRVCTLHSLAHEIVRQRPALVGLSQDFEIVDERTAGYILREVVDGWLAAHADLLERYLRSDVSLPTLLRRDLPLLVTDIALSFIKRAKDRGLAPYQLDDALRRYPAALPLARLGVDIYRDYQARLARTGVDFDDLIRLASQAIDLDPDFLARLRARWPFILEDEAQDSSLLQQQILDALTGPAGTWVRVGDPNQAIYQTFTTADPEHLRRFLRHPGVVSLPMPESGRCTPAIMALANYLIDWTMAEHPAGAARNAFSLPHMVPTPPGDPQPNPADRPGQIHLRPEKYRPAKEIQAIVNSAKQWLARNPEKTVAILDSRNKRGVDIANALRAAGVEYVELLSSSASTRSAAGVLGNLLRYLARPEDGKQLAVVFKAWHRNEWDNDTLLHLFEQLEQAIQRCRRLEDYLWPRPGHDWLEQILASLAEQAWANGIDPAEDESVQLAQAYLTDFKNRVRRWHEAAILPIDQLVLLLAQDWFASPAELALCYKFAVLLRQAAAENPAFRLPQFADLLGEIARNQRRFIGFDDEESGFEPPKNKVTVATMHRAKGLEWDRVYLMGMSNYGFPSGQPQDSYYAEKWYVRDSLNLEAEILGQLAAAGQTSYAEGDATQEARFSLVKERLRLLFVGITRAKEELVITWNVGKQLSNMPENQPAIPLVALQTWREGHSGEIRD
jgi:DNA helicase-2/ATP-dependent DNA helicase PcrA